MPDSDDTRTASGGLAPAGLPPMFVGRRRRYLAALVATGLGQAVAGGIGALTLSRAFHASVTQAQIITLSVLVLVAVGIGLLRMGERVLAEQLSQHYVHVVRAALVRTSLNAPGIRSLGVTVARTTNDLTSIKNWVALGIAPLVSGVPLMLGATVALALLDPIFAAAALVPLLALGVSLGALAPVAYRRSRTVRKARGRLAGHLADAMLASATIRAGGGQQREVGRVEKLSQRVVQASIARARAAGALRGVAATATGLATATVVGAGFYQHVPTGTIAGAITVVGLLASPVHDMGRVVEYRQSYRAARRIIEPVLAADSAPGTGRAPAAGRPGRGLVQISGVRVPDGDALPEVDLDAGACIVLDTDDRRATTRVMEVLAGLRLEDGAQVVVNGFDLASTDPQVRRGLIGYAAQGMRIERGPLQRAVRYRIPQTDPAATWAVLREVDLARVVERLPDAELTELRHGGEPLTVADRARLLLARAMLGEPPLLLLDHLDSDLGRAGREFLRDRLAGYPGVVVLASDEPKEIVQASHVWSFP